jgi:hypothetical protein
MVDIAFLAAILATAFCLTSFAMPAVIRKMKAAGIVGHDVNKPGRPEVAEMGGLGIVMGRFYRRFSPDFMIKRGKPAKQSCPGLRKAPKASRRFRIYASSSKRKIMNCPPIWQN